VRAWVCITLKGVLHVDGVFGEVTTAVPDFTPKDGARFRVERVLRSPEEANAFSTSTSISFGAAEARIVDRRSGEGRAEPYDEDDDVDAIESRLCDGLGEVGIKRQGGVSEEPTVALREFGDRA